MNSRVRTSGGDKVPVHNVNNALDSSMDLELVRLIKQINEDQQQNNKEFESCIVNLADGKGY